jgi:hypothetical protein
MSACIFNTRRPERSQLDEIAATRASFMAPGEPGRISGREPIPGGSRSNDR